VINIVLRDAECRSFEGVTSLDRANPHPHPYLFVQVGDIITPRGHRDRFRVTQRVWGRDPEEIDNVALWITLEPALEGRS
jgi:hypothetical protein